MTFQLNIKKSKAPEEKQKTPEAIQTNKKQKY